jgi:hypothetical protein
MSCLSTIRYGHVPETRQAPRQRLFRSRNTDEEGADAGARALHVGGEDVFERKDLKMLGWAGQNDAIALVRASA